MGVRITRRFRVLASGVLLASVVGLVAIPTVDSGAASKPPLVVGFECACTGPEASSIAISDPVYRAWVDYINAHGGINGQKVQVIVKDDGDDPGVALTNVTNMINSDHIVALVDNTNVDSSFSTYAQQHKVPVIGAITSSTEMYTNPDFFPEGQTQNDVNTAMVVAAKKSGGTKLAFLYCAEAAVCQQSVAPLRSIGNQLGVPLVYTTAITYDAPNYTAPCVAAKQSGADVLWIAQAIAATLSAASSCATQGFLPHEVLNDGGLSGQFTSSHAYNHHLLSIQPNIPFPVKSTPAMKTMYQEVAKYAPSALTPANLDEEVVQSWASGIMLQTAAQLGGSGTVTSASLLKGLHSFKDQTLQGMAPPLTFNTAGHQVNCWFYLSIQDNKFTTPYGLQTFCHKPLG